MCDDALAMSCRAANSGSLATALLVVWTSAASLSAQAPPKADGHGRDKLDEYNRALGVECSHCHVPEQWTDDSKPAKAQARKMREMVALLNGTLLKGIGQVRCWTCHAGQTQPARLAQDAMDAQIAKWPPAIADASQGTKLTMAVFSASTGLRCAQCHDPTDWKKVATDKMRMVPRMAKLFPAMQPFMPAEARTQCHMCHKGSNKPKTSP
jgi:Photosynthetic reaction centre cytochrome C subunit